MTMKMRSKNIITLLTLLLFGCMWAGPTLAESQTYAYVTNYSSATVSVIDTSSNTIVTTIPTGTQPLGVAITPDGAFAYVTNFNLAQVSVIETSSNTVIATIPVGVQPRRVAITPDGAFAYVTNQNNSGSGTVSVIETSSNTVIAMIPVGTRPVVAAITPDGAFAYVTNYGSGNVSVIDTSSNAVVATVPVQSVRPNFYGPRPFGVAITPDGAFAYIILASDSIVVIETSTNTVVDTLAVGRFAFGVTFTPDGAFAYVANYAADNVLVLDTSTNTVVATVPVGSRPRDIAITPDGAFAYVGSSGGRDVSVIDTSSNTVVDTITVSLYPFALAIASIATPPTAVAGADQSIRAGDTVNLNGSASFDDNTLDLGYVWSFFSLPEGSTATLTGANTATPSFVADLVGTYVVELVVTDESELLSLADQVEISTNNLAPTAVAGDDELVIVYTPVTLDGSASSDPENNLITYTWSLISQPINSNTVLIDGSAPAPRLIPDMPGTYEVTLVVSDFLGEGEVDQVNVVATTAEGYAEILIMDADFMVAALAKDQFTKKGNQKKFRKLLSKAIKDIDNANGKTSPEKAAKEIDKAIKKLNDAIVRTDGCPIWGDSPDDKDNAKDRGKPKPDWITDCLVQNDVHVLLSDAVDALKP
jgi:YVTN family beta-propeller protein